ncbi:glutathione-disulfide reductase [Zavarzinia aquatilis]|uniref:Glutathione reductase n=1 Tax=Zavarzinia aquatilis TaxID=2211142 RepID=A0A317ECH5_9PROT|nr:glutathione-disulfide reductase [Zavarzinia aquatilis]PWR24738.1 glutathione-disulfide reductase [Zavarzinia aquatilis]
MTNNAHPFDYDLFVIGAGSGGVRAARISAGHGARVAIAEEYRVGGTCVIRGCVPKKLLSYASHYGEDIADAAAYGWNVTGPVTFDWPTLIAAKDKEIDRLNGLYLKGLEGAGVTLLEGRARLVDAHTVEVAGQSVTAAHILIATGATPEVPDIPGADLAITSNEAFHLPALPKRVVVVGAGYIAVEFAGIFHGLGSHTTIVHRRGQLLRGFDDDIARHLGDEYARKGIALHFNASPTAIDKVAGGLVLHLSDGTSIEADAVMFATGRRPNTKGLGLENAGVVLGQKGEVKVDLYSRSNVPNIYAVGDVTDRMALTPVAIKEGHAFADTVFGGRPGLADHNDVPTAVFSQPAIGTVGLTEAQAAARFGTVDIYEAGFRPMKHTLTGRATRTYMKLIVEPRSDRVVGAHLIGDDTPEIIQALGIAVKMGATKAQFDRTVAVHPTAAEELVLMRTRARIAKADAVAS